MASFSAKNKSVTLKTVYNKKKIQIFGMNMPFIAPSEAKNAYSMCGEAKNAYFMSGEATNEIYIFSLHVMK